MLKVLAIAGGLLALMAARPDMNEAPAVKPAPSPVLPEDSPRPSRELTLQESRWFEAEIHPQWVSRVDAAVDRYVANRSRYATIEKMRPSGVPARVVFVLHGRESTWSFRHHLHEGSPLTARTRWIPKDRPAAGNPPFTFEESAEDALYVLKSMHRWDWSALQPLLQNIERYNGLGYQRRGLPSPYLWSGTTAYVRGKFVADGKFSKLAVDKQIGCATILKRMRQRGIH